MSEPLYTRDILRLASAIPFLVRFDEVKGVEKRSTTCGSRVRMAVALDAAGRVVSLSQAVEACAFGQAAAAVMAVEAIGRDIEEVRAGVAGVETWLAGDDQAITAWPGLAVLESARSRVGRHGAILLPFRALLAAIESAT